MSMNSLTGQHLMSGDAANECFFFLFFWGGVHFMLTEKKIEEEKKKKKSTGGLFFNVGIGCRGKVSKVT